MQIGIEKIGFFVPPTYIEMDDLAHARDTDPNKYRIGIGQDQMAIATPAYDSVAMGINAAKQIISASDRQQIDTVIFATETGVDHSKAGAIWIHHFLKLTPYARAIEMKQACYSATAAIRLAQGHIALNPESKVLVVASDIAKYGLQTGGEPTQGAGAVAILLSSQPKIIALDSQSAAFTQEMPDFWRPLYSTWAFVDGKYSNAAYLDTLQATWACYHEKTSAVLSDFDILLFHVPYTKMGRKALQALANQMSEDEYANFEAHYEKAIVYNRRVGNIYTGSLYLSLLSLLEQDETLQAGMRLGLFSYGSGAVGEFFTGTLLSDYEKHIYPAEHKAMLDERQKLTIDEYEAILGHAEKNEQVDEQGNLVVTDSYARQSDVRYAGAEGHHRHYI